MFPVRRKNALYYQTLLTKTNFFHIIFMMLSCMGNHFLINHH